MRVELYFYMFVLIESVSYFNMEGCLGQRRIRTHLMCFGCGYLFVLSVIANSRGQGGMLDQNQHKDKMSSNVHLR